MLAPGNWLAPMLRARLEAGFGAHPVLGAPVASLLSLSSVLEERFWQADAGQVRAYAPAVPWPDTRLTQPLQTVAQAIKADMGLRIATVDYGGWDTHVNQAYEFHSLLSDLSRALMAFWRDLGPRQQRCGGGGAIGVRAAAGGSMPRPGRTMAGRGDDGAGAAGAGRRCWGAGRGSQ